MYCYARPPGFLIGWKNIFCASFTFRQIRLFQKEIKYKTQVLRKQAFFSETQKKCKQKGDFI